MKKPLKVFVDSDVVISSLLSKSGAAYILIHGTKLNLQLFISHVSYKELILVTERLGLSKNELMDLTRKKFKMAKLKTGLNKLKEEYADYVTDANDAHIVGGVVTAKARFLISYNLKHFKTDKIKADFGIIITSPALLLQYLRSIT